MNEKHKMYVKQMSTKKAILPQTRYMWVLLLTFSLFSLANTLKAYGNDFYLNAQIKGLPAGVKIILKDAFDKEAKPLKTTKSFLGGFKIHALIDEPLVVKLIVGKNKVSQYMYIQSGVLKMEGNVKTKCFKFSGMESEKEFEIYMSPLSRLKDSIYAVIENRTEVDDASEKKMEVFQQQIKEKMDEFLISRKDSISAAMCLYLMQATFKSNAELEPFYNTLTNRIQQSKYGLKVKALVEKSKIGAVGTMAKDFELKSARGEIVHLSDYRGKYLLLNFWSSWSEPCRLNNLDLVNAYITYNDKNFEVLSVSVEYHRENWVQAINNDGLTWKQVNDCCEFNGPVAELYNVQELPTNFLIDPSGKIVAKKLKGSKLFTALKLLLK